VDKLPVSFDNISLDFKARRFISGQDELPVIRHHIWLGSFTEQQKSLLFGPELRGYEAATRERIVRESNDCAAKDHINKILHCDRRLYLEGDILTKVDRASMSNGLEVRVPFLNREMLEFSDRIPWQYKIRRGITKYILRKSFKGYLPDSILKRGKKGFNMPVAKWLLGPLKPLAQDMLSEKRLNRHGYFDGHYVGHLLKEHLSGKRDNRKLLWTLIVFEMWRDRWTKP
jgi:asparagine synthase (glutamine-hydrolysing)